MLSHLFTCIISIFWQPQNDAINRWRQAGGIICVPTKSQSLKMCLTWNAFFNICFYLNLMLLPWLVICLVGLRWVDTSSMHRVRVGFVPIHMINLIRVLKLSIFSRMVTLNGYTRIYKRWGFGHVSPAILCLNWLSVLFISDVNWSRMSEMFFFICLT